MPQVTYGVVDVDGADPVRVRSVQVQLVAPGKSKMVFRASDGAEVRPSSVVELSPTNGVYPSGWSVDLLPNSELWPAGSHYLISQRLVGDRTGGTPAKVVVPAGPGPYRLGDLVNGVTAPASAPFGIAPFGTAPFGGTAA